MYHHESSFAQVSSSSPPSIHNRCDSNEAFYLDSFPLNDNESEITETFEIFRGVNDEEIEASCPICFESFYGANIYTCPTCANHFDSCVLQALKLTRKTCPMCRQPWDTFERDLAAENRFSLSHMPNIPPPEPIEEPPPPSFDTLFQNKPRPDVSTLPPRPTAPPQRPPRPRMSNRTPSAPPETSHTINSKPAEPLWECKRCTFHNPINAKACEMCAGSKMSQCARIVGENPPPSPSHTMSHRAPRRAPPRRPSLNEVPMPTLQHNHSEPVLDSLPMAQLAIDVDDSEYDILEAIHVLPEDGLVHGDVRRRHTTNEDEFPHAQPQARDTFAEMRNAQSAASAGKRNNDAASNRISRVPVLPFRCKILLRVSSKKIFRKWKPFELTVTHDRLVFRCEHQEARVFYLHRFMCFEKPHNEFQLDREGCMYRSRLFENMLHEIYRNRKIFQAGKFISDASVMHVSKVLELGSKDLATMNAVLDVISKVILHAPKVLAVHSSMQFAH